EMGNVPISGAEVRSEMGNVPISRESTQPTGSICHLIDPLLARPHSMKHSVLLVLSMLAGCTAQPTVTSWLDPVSVATITSQSTPLVLAHGSYSSTTQRAFAQ